MMAPVIWMYIAIGAITVAGISIIALLFLWTMAGQEGRFFFKRGFNKKGIDVLRHEPLSNRLRLITVKWNGQYFQHGKELIFFGIEKIINPKEDAEKYFNEVVSRMCTWYGCRTLCCIWVVGALFVVCFYGVVGFAVFGLLAVCWCMLVLCFRLLCC